jgi:fucose permease
MKTGTNFKALPVYLAFLAMGFQDAVGPYVSLAKSQFHLSTTVASMIPLVGMGMFGLLSIPAGLLQDRRGKKFVLMLGLSLALAGVLNAAFGLTDFPRFLLTVLLVGAGAAIMQVSGTPIMRDVSAPGKFPRNLVLGQFVKAIGSLSGPVIPAVALRYFGVGWGVIFPIYSVAFLISLLACGTLRVHREVATGASAPKAATLGSCLALLKNGYILALTAAIFVYIGAEVCVSAGIPLLMKEQYNLDITKVGMLGTGLFFVALMTGRFLGGVILNWLSAPKFLVLTCIAALAGLGGMFMPSRTIAVAGFILIGLGFANIFPLIFAIAIEHMPSRTNEISGLMVTAIVGGAILPPLMGVIADHSTVRIGFLVPLLAILYVTVTALLTLKVDKTPAAA